MDLVILEVDGSLANPYAAATVAIWTAFLSSVAVGIVRRFVSSGGHGPTTTFLFTVVVLVTKPAQWLIGNVLYWIVDHRITSVGFWGGPPVWIAPVVSCCVGFVTWSLLLAQNRRRSGTNVSAAPGLRSSQQ